MEYTNERIQQLIEERDAAMQKYNSMIQDEIRKEKLKYKFDWKNFLLIVVFIIAIFAAFEGNKKLFPKTSKWSWEYYFGN